MRMCKLARLRRSVQQHCVCCCSYKVRINCECYLVSAADYWTRLGFQPSNRRGINEPQIELLATRVKSVVPGGYEGGSHVKNATLDVFVTSTSAYSLQIIGALSKV